MAEMSGRVRDPQAAGCPYLVPQQAHPVVPPALRPICPGAIRPRGRWRRTLEVIADGWLRRVVAARHPWYYNVFWERNTFTEWIGDVHGEWSGYVADAIVRLARLLPDSWIAGERSPWLENVLAAQDPDGYLGINRPEHRWKHGFEIWSQDRLLQALLYEYEYSGDERVLQATVRAARCIVRNLQSDWFSGVWSRPRTIPGPRQAAHSVNIVHPLLALYQYTGDPALRDGALDYYRDFDRSSWDITATAFLSLDNLMTHIVTVCEHLSIPAKIYAFTGEMRYLDASLRAFSLLSHSLQVTGVPSGNEFTYGKGPRKYTEHCGAVEWIISCTRLALQTGQVHFADAAERAMFNSYFGSKSPDGNTLCYNHAPNQVVATNWSGPYEDNWDHARFRNHYATNHEPRCCNANTSRGFPNFVETAVAETTDGGLAFVYYGPMEVRLGHHPTAGSLSIEVDTDYPFEDEVRMLVRPDVPVTLPLRFRIPGWCRSAELRINGEPWPYPVRPGRFALVERRWRSGDEIVLRFDVPIMLDWYTHSLQAVPGAAVVRGPLTYCLPIPEDWVYVGQGKPGPENLEEEWNVVPADGAVWNIALEIDPRAPESSLLPATLDVPANALPWKHAPIGLVCKARRLPQWQTDTVNGKPQTPALPVPPLQPDAERFNVTLVPFGFTHIRMTYLPVVGIERNEDIRRG